MYIGIELKKLIDITFIGGSILCVLRMQGALAGEVQPTVARIIYDGGGRLVLKPFIAAEPS